MNLDPHGKLNQPFFSNFHQGRSVSISGLLKALKMAPLIKHGITVWTCSTTPDRALTAVKFPNPENLANKYK